MKILSAAQIRKADQYTIDNEPVSSIDLMERAAGKCVEWISEKIDKKKKIRIICGLGNNGGDGLAIARLLHKKGYNIHVVIVRYSDNTTNDFLINEERIRKIKKVTILDAHSISDIHSFEDTDVIIDAILGSGLSKPLEGILYDLVQIINESNAFVVSIDLPSGLFPDNNTANNLKGIVQADVTLAFQVPKLSFLLPQNYFFVGEWLILDIGLNKEYMSSLDSAYYFMELNDIQQILKPRSKFAHKGNFGHALLISGSFGKIGAAILASKACLRSGAGLLTTHVPQCGYDIIQKTVPEAMCSVDDEKEFIAMLPDISKYNVIAIGPGIGTNEETQKIIKLLIQNAAIPLIFDADALNILSENKTWLAFLPKNTILTPHPKEFERLAGKPANDYDRLQIQKEFSVKYSVYIIYKGAYSTISTPDGKLYFNSTGNPGMATGGSGDVLTGILLGLKASGYSSFETCILGTYIHGLAGDMAAQEKGETSLMAGDIVDLIANAFNKIIV